MLAELAQPYEMIDPTEEKFMKDSCDYNVTWYLNARHSVSLRAPQYARSCFLKRYIILCHVPEPRKSALCP